MCNSCNSCGGCGCNTSCGNDMLLNGLKNLFAPLGGCPCNRSCPCRGGNPVAAIALMNTGCGCNSGNTGNTGCGCNSGNTGNTGDAYYIRQYALCGCGG